MNLGGRQGVACGGVWFKVQTVRLPHNLLMIVELDRLNRKLAPMKASVLLKGDKREQ